MKLSLAKRHWFNNEATLIALENGVEKLQRGAELGQRYGVEISFLLSTLDSALPESDRTSYLDRAEHAVGVLRKSGIRVDYNRQGATAGYKFVSQLFGTWTQRTSEQVLGLACLDQYPFYEEEHVEAAVDLAGRLLTDDKLYANGSRNVPVILGTSPDASDLRIIHEMVHALAAKPDVFKVQKKPQWATPSPVYAHFGESTSGFYLLNPQHAGYQPLSEVMQTHRELTAKNGFPLEYFTAISAGNQDAVSTGYVYAVENAYYATVSPEQAHTNALKFIENHTDLVGQTPARVALERVLADESAVAPLTDFFHPELIHEVFTLMGSTLSRSK